MYMNNNQRYSYLKDTVERKLDFTLTDNDKKFMKDYEEQFIMKIIYPSNKKLSKVQFSSMLETFIHQNPSLVPLQLSFDIIPFVEVWKSQLESRKPNIKPRKSESKMMSQHVDQINKIHQKSKKLDEKSKWISKEYFK